MAGELRNKGLKRMTNSIQPLQCKLLKQLAPYLMTAMQNDHDVTYRYKVNWTVDTSIAKKPLQDVY